MNVFATKSFWNTVGKVYFKPSQKITWWQHQHNGEEVRFPMVETAKGKWHIIGSKEVTDYWEPIGSNNWPAAWKHFLETIHEHDNWQEITFLSVSAPSKTYEIIDEVENKHIKIITTLQDVTPQLFLGDTWDDYLSHLRRKYRHEIRRKLRNINKVDHQVRVITESDNLDEHIAAFIKLHKLSSPDKAAFWNEKTTSFFYKLLHEFAKKGWLKLYFLEVKGELAAIMLVFTDKDRWYLYNSGFDPADKYRSLSTGNVLTSITIKDAVAAGATIYDFLRGDEHYKFRFGAKAVPLYDVKLKRV